MVTLFSIQFFSVVSSLLAFWNLFSCNTEHQNDVHFLPFVAVVTKSDPFRNYIPVCEVEAFHLNKKKKWEIKRRRKPWWLHKTPTLNGWTMLKLHRIDGNANISWKVLTVFFSSLDCDRKRKYTAKSAVLDAHPYNILCHLERSKIRKRQKVSYQAWMYFT